MKLIDAQHISHSYNGKDLVLDDICLTIRRGEFLSILGASGSGKTTLLSVLGGMPDRNNTNQPRSNSFRRFCTAESCQYVYYCLRSARATSSENLLL